MKKNNFDYETKEVNFVLQMFDVVGTNAKGLGMKHGRLIKERSPKEMPEKTKLEIALLFSDIVRGAYLGNVLRILGLEEAHKEMVLENFRIKGIEGRKLAKLGFYEWQNKMRERERKNSKRKGLL